MLRLAGLALLGLVLAVGPAAGDEGRVMVAEFYPVQGSVDIPKELRASAIQITLNANGERMKTSPKENGDFEFSDVPPGSHLLEVVAMGYFYPPVRIDVSARHKGKVLAAWSEDRRKVLPDLHIEPIGKMNYFEKRDSFSLRSFLMNPMMLMMLFTLVCVVIFSNIDPETFKEMQREAEEERKKAANLLSASGSGGKKAA